MSEEFIDAQSHYSQDDRMGIREIVMAHIQKISEISNNEFRPGYWKKKPVNLGGTITTVKTYEEDKRDKYINSVNFLYDILLPKLDEEAEDKIKEIEDEKEEEIEKKDTNNEKKNIELEYTRKKFQEISRLLSRKNYLKTGGIEDG